MTAFDTGVLDINPMQTIFGHPAIIIVIIAFTVSLWWFVEAHSLCASNHWHPEALIPLGITTLAAVGMYVIGWMG
jgi:hypothetical protein